ncbi:MAG: amino acid permease, partial [Aurantibacter sp.]
YMGVESATIPAENIENPGKTIPKATMLGTVITAMVYILGTAVVMGMIPLEALSKSPAPFADAMTIISGEWGRNLIAFGAAVAAFGGLNGWILVQGQIASATAKDSLFPKLFKKENTKGAPIFGIILGSILTSIVMLMNYTDGLVDQFKFLILLTALCILIPYLFSSAAYVLIKIKRRTGSTEWFSILALGGLAFAYSLWAVFGAGEKAVFWGFLLLLSGIPLYVWMKRK